MRGATPGAPSCEAVSAPCCPPGAAEGSGCGAWRTGETGSLRACGKENPPEAEAECCSGENKLGAAGGGSQP